MIARLGPLCLLVSALFAQELKISLGPAPGQVLQRDADGRATIKLAGTALRAANKIVEARVLNAAGPLPGFDWKALERVKANKWGGLLQGVPQGGPYSLEVRIVAGTPEVIKDIYIGDLWVLAGQSNMEGVGNLLDVESPEERVRSSPSGRRAPAWASPSPNRSCSAPASPSALSRVPTAARAWTSGAPISKTNRATRSTAPPSAASSPPAAA